MNDELIDTNLLVYAFHPNGTVKHIQARLLIDKLTRSQKGVISSQNLVEFGNVMLRKANPELTFEDMKKAVRKIADAFLILLPNEDTVPLALDAVKKFQLAYFDALIWAIAKQHSISEILTEDLPGGRTSLGGVNYRNPLDAQ